MAKITDKEVMDAVHKWAADLDPHTINEVHWIGYYGAPNPKGEPRLHEPSDYPKVMIMVSLTFKGETKRQERVVFLAKPQQTKSE